MLDLVMALTLAASYAVFAFFLKWCGTVVQQKGGERE